MVKLLELHSTPLILCMVLKTIEVNAMEVQDVLVK
jgi:hypothetical protein